MSIFDDFHKPRLGSSLLSKAAQIEYNRGQLQSFAKAAVVDDESWGKFIELMWGSMRQRLTVEQLEKVGVWVAEATQKNARELLAQRLISIACGDVFDASDPMEVEQQLKTLQQQREYLDKERQDLERLEVNIRAHKKRVEKLRRQLKQVKHKQDRVKLFADIEKLVADIQQQEEQLLGQRDRFTEASRILQETGGRLATAGDIADITITVGYLVYNSKDRGRIPIYPVIEVWFPTAVQLTMPDQLLLSFADRRYKIYEPGKKNAPLAEVDDPVEEEAHEQFQRLLKHWNGWFLRINGRSSQWDFQIGANGVVEELEYPIEFGMKTFDVSREQLLNDFDKDALAGTNFAHSEDRNGLIDMLDKYEALTGPFPVAKAGLATQPGKVHAMVVHRADPPRTTWATIDREKLVENIRRTIGGNFLSMVFEDLRPGTDFIQLIGDSPNRKNSQPDIWFRCSRTARFESLGDTGPIETMGGKALPLQEFNPEALMDLEDTDRPTVLNIYRRTPRGIDNNMSTVSRVQQMPIEDTIVDKSVHEVIIQNYLRLCEAIRLTAASQDPAGLKVWPHLKDAVIFELPTSAYMTLYTDFFNYCVRVAKVDPDLPLEKHSEKQRKRVMDVIRTGKDAPFPEKVPFRACFFAFGRGVRNVNAAILEAELRKNEPNAPSVGHIIGQLVTSTGLVVTFSELGDGSREGITMSFDRDPTSALGNRWDRVTSMAPWIVNALISYVNEHKKLVETGANGFAHRTLTKKIAKGLAIKAPVPPPFYVVLLKDEFVREQVRQRASAIKRHIEWQHRWNVRGHDCIRYMRGPLPIEPETEAELSKRGYKIFKDTSPDADTFMALAKRGVAPKAPTEWLAVLSYWRDSFVKGPEDKPLIESVRRSEKPWELP